MEQSLLHCDLCGQSYENGQIWCEHINQGQQLETIASVEIQEEKSDDSLTADDVYPCLECGKIYKSKYGMARHVKIKHSYGNGFNCKICSQTFATKLLLREHLAQTHPDDPNLIKCPVCDKIFADKGTLSQHFKSHRTDRPFKCNVCERAYKDKQDLVYHEKMHLPTREHVCEQCGKSFLRARNLKHHIETHSDVKPFQCEVCNKTFRTNVHLRVHTRHHTNPHQFECFICEKKFAMKHALKRHLVTHRQKKQYPCSQCNKAYHFKHKLTHHVKSAHNNERPFKCQECDRTFTSRDNLRIHFRIHSGERPYQCSMCERTFSQVSNKLRHELIHKAIKAFKCSVCKRSFYTQYEHSQHMLIHETSDSKPFKCTECDKGFVKAFSLKLHVERIHLGIRHTCTICQKSYKVAFNFKQHMKQHLNGSKTVENGSEENGETNEEGNEQELEQSNMAESQGADDQQNVSTLSASNTLKMLKRKQRCDQTVRPYSCDQCSQSFRRVQDIKRHIDSVHKPFKCERCKKRFSVESELEAHTPSCSGPESEFQCPECGNTFASKANLKRHMDIHSGAEPKQCQQCGKTFRNEKLLQKHQVVHSDKREFACHRCDKAFRRAEDLVKHTRTHTGEAPYKCRYCNRAFKQGNNRRRHEQTHTHEKPFKCEICNRSFSTGSEAKEHQLTHQVPDGKYFKCHICQRGFSHSKSLKSHVQHVHVNPKYGCSLCSMKFPTRREAKKHEKTHQGGGTGLGATMADSGVVEGGGESVEWQEGTVTDSGVEVAEDGGGGVEWQGGTVADSGVEVAEGAGGSVGWQGGTVADSGVGMVDIRESVGGGVEQHGVTVGENDGVSGVELDGSVGQVQHLLCEVRREIGSNDKGGSGEVGESGEGAVQSIVMTYIDGVIKIIENDDVRGKDGDSGLENSGVRSEPHGHVAGQVPKGRKTQTNKRAKQGSGSRKRRQQNKGTGGKVRGQNRVEQGGEEVRIRNEELNNETEQNNEITNDVEKRQVNEERTHDGQVHESHELRELEETQPVVRVNCEVSQASERNEIPGRQAKRVIERSKTKRQISGNVNEKRKSRHDGELLGGKRKDVEGRNKQKKVVDRRGTETSDVIARQDIEANDVRVQSKRRVVRAVGNTNLTTVRNIGATSDLIITKVIRAKNGGGTRNDEKSRENSRTRISEEQRNESQVTSNTPEIARKDVAHSESMEDAGEERDNSNTTYVDIRNDNVQNSDATKSQEGRGTDTSRNNEASNEAIRKILEGKPFICPVCDKGHASRNGLKHHYKTHQNGNENKTPLYYCHECKEGFKTKRKFWLHDVKVHGLIETSSDESDSGQEERNMTDTCTNVMSAGVIRGDGMVTRGPGEGQRDVLSVAEGDLSTCRDDPVIDVDYVDGRKVKQSKITDWFH